MAEYIEREAVRLAYESSLKNDTHKKEGASAIHLQEHRHILHVLDKIPAADVVEVVRCKDCKHLNVWNRKDLYAHCPKTNTVFLPFKIDTREHFCSYGERRSDDG